ncbi:hypothetical protein D1970_08820 [Mesobacillus zeae]|uniref:Helix-turn-helix domain containing protein n=1 Tax=Mesobacillus zeae TaxID=1917180 RepID=A0A398B776_9BACI|nr:hypothetical protein D1970_08820 [Mesobacillus zeae]
MKSAGRLEAKYLKNRRRYIYTAMDNVKEVEWHWSAPDVIAFQELWEAGISIKDIAAYFKQSELSVFLLSLDRLSKDKITPREGWNIW